ncbi:MAG: 23S rRNA (adenine(2030)-N(6))-methyltransferase RlmJ [Betaproteobacteria bacterium]|jgi:23S rRNA (adenine2030-N6)-methyltransferase
MFSYRHAFHAGNHADVLKHAILISIVKYMTEKPVPLTVIDTHAGAGLYRMDSELSAISAEAQEGIQLILAQPHLAKSKLITEYLGLLHDFNPSPKSKLYPGSPFIVQHLLNDFDKLKLFELHPTDTRLLEQHVAQLKVARQVAVLRADGFEGMKKFLPPAQRRALVVMDPSYEIKTDYSKVLVSIQDALKRFATGTYLVWYPLIARAEAHDLPKRLKTMAQQSKRDWLHVSLIVKSSKFTALPSELLDGGKQKRPGLPGSGVFVINPPYTLKAELQEAMPELVSLLGQDPHAQFHLEGS